MSTQQYAKKPYQRKRKPAKRAPARRAPRRPYRQQQMMPLPPQPIRNEPSDLGGDIGKWVGSKLGHLIGKITGFGDYTIQGNSVMQGGMTPPQMVNSIDRGGVIVRHREYMGDIISSTDFNLQSYDINPGLQTVFPWLSSVAECYEEYSFRGLVFEFKSMSADSPLASATSTALGSVIMATSYNSLSPPFHNKVEMANYDFANSAKPSESFIHPVECKRAWNPVSELYVRTALVDPSTSDQRLYDLGKFQIAVVGCQSDVGVIGELWASYEIEFFKPKYATNTLSSHIQLGSVTNTAPLGTAVVRSASQTGSTLGGVINAAGTSYSFPPSLGFGTFLVNWVVVGSSTACTLPGISYTNCSNKALWVNDTAVRAATPNGTTTTANIICFILQIDAPEASFTFTTGGTLPASITSGDLFITELSDDIIY